MAVTNTLEIFYRKLGSSSYKLNGSNIEVNGLFGAAGTQVLVIDNALHRPNTVLPNGNKTLMQNKFSYAATKLTKSGFSDWFTDLERNLEIFLNNNAKLCFGDPAQVLVIYATPVINGTEYFVAFAYRANAGTYLEYFMDAKGGAKQTLDGGGASSSGDAVDGGILADQVIIPKV